MSDLHGWINIYKPLNISSFKTIDKIKKKFNLKKLGHAGTLDPLAEGILPIAIGKTTKLISYITNQCKEYEFEIKWGIETSTGDREGEIISTNNKIPSDSEINKKLNSFFGNYLQKPPMASAVKVNGVRAYKLFRKNENFDLIKKKVEIFDLKLIPNSQKKISKMLISCGKGFYIRSFAIDLAESLNTKGHIYSLKRTKVGDFSVKNSILLDDLLKIGEMSSEIKGYHSSVSMLDDILALDISDKKILNDISYGKIVKINDENLAKPLVLSERKLYLIVNDKSIVSLGSFEGNYFKPKRVFI
tara:strand:+ start:236 stop:1141 length:906 start_codon:yes stop_codon:yes gene_type:complete